MTQKIVLLLVEDEPLIQLGIQEALEEGGYAVLTAAGGAEAMTVLESRHGEISGLITDIRLGSGPNGWEVAHHARELKADLAVLYITGDSAAQWLVQGVPKSTLVEKPFADAQIVTAISTMLIEAGTSS